MIAAITCACGHPGPTVHVLAPEARPAAVFVARLAAVRSGWAVDVESINSNTIGGVCAVCRARSNGALYQEMRR